MTPVEALARIAALCDEYERQEHIYYPAIHIESVRAVLADVEPEPSGVLDRDDLSRVQPSPPATLLTRRCAWEQCPGLPPTVPMHEAEDGPEWHDICRNASIAPEAVRELVALYSSLAQKRKSAAAAPGGVLDRDQALALLNTYHRGDFDGNDGEFVDALAAAVRPAVLDRDALIALMRRWHPYPGNEAAAIRADAILALVRPAAGVTLTREEVALAAQWARDVREMSGSSGLAAERALAARLEREAGA